MISVIIPVYNADKFIIQNYYNLSMQTDRDFEIIYINDGSEDESLVFLLDIEAYDSRVKILSQRNTGAMIARINGIKESKFEYITFLDVDDTVDINFISDFKNDLLKGYDLIVTGFKIKDGESYSNKNNINSGIYSKNEYLLSVLSKSSWELCGKVFNKKLFDIVDLPDRRLSVAEDTYIFIQVLLNLATEVFVVDTFNYFYHVVDNSISRQKNILFIEDALYVALVLKEKLIHFGIHIDYINCMTLLLYSNSLRRGMLSSNHPYFKVINSAFKLDALLMLPKHKMIFVMMGFFINRVFK